MSGPVCSIQLVNGIELIGRVDAIDSDSGQLMIHRPLAVLPGKDEKGNLTPTFAAWGLTRDESADVSLYVHALVGAPVKADPRAAAAWEQAVTPIDLSAASSQIVLG
jgi:hypothetical protein